MNEHLRQIDEWRRETTRREPARVKGRNGPGWDLRRRTTARDNDQSGEGATFAERAGREESDPVLVRDELWSILQRMRMGGHADDASRLERVYLHGGSIAAEGKMRVHRARVAAKKSVTATGSPRLGLVTVTQGA